MDDDSKLSIERMMETAMGLSMASLFQQAMTTAGKTLQQSLDPAAPGPPPRYIYAMIGGNQQGPFSLGEIVAHIRAGEITPSTYIWKSGMSAWKPAREVTDLAPELGAVPPQMPQSDTQR